MKYLLSLVVLAAALVLPGFATAQAAAPYLDKYLEVTQAAPPVASPTTTVRAPAANTTVQTTGDVQSSTKISVGTIAGEFLNTVLGIFAVPVGVFLSGILFRIFKGVGVNLSTQNEAKLQDSINRAVVAFSNAAPKLLDGRMTVDVKSQVIAKAISYVREHRADTLKALGVDPGSQKTAEALEARAEVAIADPAVPTPEVVPTPAATATPTSADLEAAVVRVLQGIRDKAKPVV